MTAVMDCEDDSFMYDVRELRKAVRSIKALIGTEPTEPGARRSLLFKARMLQAVILFKYACGSERLKEDRYLLLNACKRLWLY